MRDFFYTKKFKILLAVAVVLAGMMAWAGANGRLTNAPQEIMGALLTPVQKAAQLFSGGLDGLLDKYVRIDQIIAENEQLQQENQELRDQLVDYDQLAAENKAFRDLLNIREENPEFQYASAFVISRDPLDRFGGFTIDQGTLHGVEKGDVVVSDKGYLVGRVLEADLSSSKVMTILQPGSYVACLVSRTRDSGNLNGSADYAADGMCVLENLPRDTLAMVGDEIITTGLGGEFPANIRVGTILELLPENSGTSTIAVVEPGADINKLTHVFIVTDVSAGE
ncbi:rod shape-determining protein MreC [Candidatus Allofournierella merdipullorum]|uniref:rod shape-determining protein MreC n=1 Tax=Candidatus Allofournierella merdipullorum TaxID=2838595 RepID=UPI002A873966|nr:rod shape-determining protein MreC [Candidatus Fournierella merdipullorum]